MTADKDRVVALYTLTIEVQPVTPEGSEPVEYGAASTPELLVANFEPACVFLLNEPIVNTPSNASTKHNASAGSAPPLQLTLGIFPKNLTITLTRGGNATVMYVRSPKTSCR